MIVVSFYFWMTEANENFFLCLMFLIFKTINDNKLTMIQVNWLELDDLKFAMSCKTRLWIFEEKKLVYNIFVWYQKVTDAGHFLELMRLHSCITLTLISTTIVLYCFVEILYNVCLYVYWVCEVTKWIEN